MADHEVVVVGAGPYGLAATAHLRAAGLDVRTFGEAMTFWSERMPAGMLLRSAWEASHIADPGGELTLDRYRDERAADLAAPVPLERFVDYGRWFAERAVPDLDRRQVVRIDRSEAGFRVALEDGDELTARRVVLAAGISPFPRRPAVFDALPPELASHSADHVDLGRFAGLAVAVVGGGQSALESAALLAEAGATVEVFVRDQVVHWLRGAALRRRLGPFQRLLYTKTDVGPPGLNWIIAVPELFLRLPRELQDRIARRATRPAGAGWLVPRLAGVPIHTGRSVLAARPQGERLRLRLDDGDARTVDHLLLCTGYRVDLARYAFLAPPLLAEVRRVDGAPLLRAGYETSVAGLHVLGAPAAYSFGPVMRFVSGTGYGARGLTRVVAARRGGRAAPRAVAARA